MGQPLEVTDPADKPTVDWDSAKEFFTGKGAGSDGAGNTESQTPETPEVKTFSYKGRKIQVGPEEYEALEELRRQARGENGRLGSELAQTRERLARLEGVLAERRPVEQPTEPDLKPPPPDLAITDFAAWQAKNEAYHAAQMERLAQRLEQKYVTDKETERATAEKARRDQAWADKFYASYDHLDHDKIKPLVAQVYAEHEREIVSFGSDVEGAQERLAELADARLVELKKAGKTVDTNTRPPRLESSAGAGPRSKETDAPRTVTAASWSARERARMRGEALK